jgi:RNA polymerase sigma factor (sigma-70 family)
MFARSDEGVLTEEQKQVVLQYAEGNQEILKNPVIQGFLASRTNVLLLAQFLLRPDQEAVLQLEGAFRRYFFGVIFTKYLGSLIRFSNIDFHRKRTREEWRNPLVFDAPLEDGEATLGEMLYGTSTEIEDEIPVQDPQSFQQMLSNDLLAKAFNELTNKQKWIIMLAYSSCDMDREIAETLRITQQAVSKARATALRKMRTYMHEWQHKSEGTRRKGAG